MTWSPGHGSCSSPPGACAQCERGGVGWSELLISGPAAPRCHHLTVWSVMPLLEAVFSKTWRQAPTSHSTWCSTPKMCSRHPRKTDGAGLMARFRVPHLPPGCFRGWAWPSVRLSSMPSGTLHQNWVWPHSPLPAEGPEQWPGLKGRNGRCGGRSSLGASIPGLFMDELMISLDLPSMSRCPGWLLPLECAERACLRLPASQRPQGRVNRND